MQHIAGYIRRRAEQCVHNAGHKDSILHVSERIDL
jgi:hypothetical protein